MDKLVQGGLSIALLLSAGQCVSDIPTGVELFELQQQTEEKRAFDGLGTDRAFDNALDDSAFNPLFTVATNPPPCGTI